MVALSILTSPLTRWAAVALAVAALGLAIRHERGAAAGLRNDLHDMTASRDAWAGESKRAVLASLELRDRNDALASAAATQCGTGQTAAFERGRAFGRAEAGSPAQ